MTTEPTDEDVERLAEIVTNLVNADREEYEAFLRSGEVTLAQPEPEPPKRYTAHRSPVDGNAWFVSEDGHRRYALFYGIDSDARQRAEALRDELNGETAEDPHERRCDDGDCVNSEAVVEALLATGVWEDEIDGDGSNGSVLADHVRMLDVLRAQAEARVKELEAELVAAKAAHDRGYTQAQAQVERLATRAEEAERKLAQGEPSCARACFASLAQVRSDEAPSCDTCDDTGRLVVDEPSPFAYDGPCIDCSQVRSDEAQRARGGTFPQVDEPGVVNSEAQPVEPLFTGLLVGGVLEHGHGKQPHAKINITGDAVDGAKRAGRTEVDVYPHGSRPAPRKVTAELTAEDVEGVLLDVLAPEAYDVQARADAFNAILASKAGA